MRKAAAPKTKPKSPAAKAHDIATAPNAKAVAGPKFGSPAWNAKYRKKK